MNFGMTFTHQGNCRGQIMTVKDLINVLQNIEDKSLLIRVIENNDFDIDGNPKPNFWLSGIEVSEEGQSGYEQNGEIRLIGSE
jgi:hypothetical protein